MGLMTELEEGTPHQEGIPPGEGRQDFRCKTSFQVLVDMLQCMVGMRCEDLGRVEGGHWGGCWQLLDKWEGMSQ